MELHSESSCQRTYLSKKVALVGSVFGGMIEVILLFVGIVGSLGGHAWGTGSLIAGGATGISDILNLRRLK